jgi:putative intracellular protease/amidase
MLVAIPLFPRFTALDAVGPYEVLQRIPSIDVVFVGHPRGGHRCIAGRGARHDTWAQMTIGMFGDPAIRGWARVDRLTRN